MLATLIDSHVHYHNCYEPVKFLNAAVANLQLGAVQFGSEEAWTGCLLLADMAGQHCLDVIKKAELRGILNDWSLQTTEEDISLICRRDDGVEVTIISGRQIVCVEGVEILSLCSGQEIADGLPVREVLETVRQSGAISVLPWGFGKWWFRRGMLIKELLESLDLSKVGEVFLGDNSGRPQVTGDPHMFRCAREKGIRILPGSDPLPFPGHERNAGRYGIVLAGKPDVRRPAFWIKSRIFNNPEQPRSFGRRESLPRFCQQQVAMQIRQLQTRKQKP